MSLTFSSGQYDGLVESARLLFDSSRLTNAETQTSKEKTKGFSFIREPKLKGSSEKIREISIKGLSQTGRALIVLAATGEMPVGFKAKDLQKELKKLQKQDIVEHNRNKLSSLVEKLTHRLPGCLGKEKITDEQVINALNRWDGILKISKNESENSEQAEKSLPKHSIYTNFQRHVFKTTIDSAPTTKIGIFLQNAKLFLGAFSAAISLKIASHSHSIKREEKSKCNEDVKRLFKAAFDPKNFLSPSEVSLFQAETKIELLLKKDLTSSIYKTFKELSKLLKGAAPKRVEAIVNKVSHQITTENGTSPSKDEIRMLLFKIVEKIARDVYLIDNETLRALQGTRETRELSHRLELYTENAKVKLPSFAWPVNLLEQSKLLSLQKACLKSLNLLKKKNLNSVQIEQKEKELAAINAVLSDWENRGNIHKQINMPSMILHRSEVDQNKIKALEFARDQLQAQLEMEPDLTTKKESLAKINELQTILRETQNYQSTKGAHDKSMSEELLRIDPMLIDLKILASIQVNSDSKDFLFSAWNLVLEENQLIAKKSENPQDKVIAENKYQEAVQRLQMLAQKPSEGELFKMILAHHGITLVGGTQANSKVAQTQAYIEFREKSLVEALQKQTVGARLSQEEVKNLQMLSKMLKWGRLDNQEKLDLVTEEDKRNLEKFLFSALNDKDLNERIFAIGKGKIPLGIDEEVIDFITNYTHKSKYHKRFIRVTLKAKNLVNHLDHLTELPDQKKLSMRDFGILKQAADLAKNFEGLKKAGLLRKESYINLLEQYTTEAREVVDKINERTQAEIQALGTYKSGDIAAWQSFKWQQFLVKKPIREVELMRRWITDIGHGSFIYRSTPDESGVSKIMQSHIYGTYENGTLDSPQIAFSEIWRLDLSKLTDRSAIAYKLLEKIYEAKGLNAAEEIQKIYEEVSREIHEEKKENFVDMENQEARRFAAGLADYGLKGGHKRKVSRTDNFAKVHDQFVNGPKNAGEKKWIICSEFVTKATIASLIETDMRLIRILEDYLKENTNQPEIKAMSEQILDVNKKGSLHIIALPYDASERLKRVHPGRMIQILHDKNCIVKVDPPPIIKGIFTDKTFNPEDV